jgi:hypothetical protein
MKEGDKGQAAWIKAEDSVIASAANQQSDSIRLTRDGNRGDRMNQVSEINDFTIVWVRRYVMVGDDGIDEIFYTLGDTHLLTNPAPLETEYFHGNRPYVMGCSVIEAHRPYPSGLPRLTKDQQNEANEIANQRIDNVKWALNKRYFAKRNKQVDIRSLTRNVPGSVTLMDDPEGDVKVVDTPDVTGSSYQEQDRINVDFDDMAGVFSGGSVASNRKLNETVGGMNLLTTNANQVGGYQLRTFVETFVEPALTQLAQLESFYETDEMVLLLAGKNAQLSKEFDLTAVTDHLLMQDVVINVSVGMGATNPQDKVQTLMLGLNSLKQVLDGGVLERYGLKVDEVISEILGVLGYKQGKRFFDSGEQDPQIAALTQTIQELQQQLDAKQPPEVIAATVKKLEAEAKKINAEALAANVAAEYSAMQAGQVIASMPAVAPIADVVMQAAGYQPPTPPGVDPNFPQPAMAPPVVPGVPQNTSPMLPPVPQSPMQGIETARADG